MKFYEDSRGIFTLQIQKFTTDTGTPHKIHFTFVNEEITRLFNFIRNIALLPVNDTEAKKFDDKYLQEVIISKDQAVRLIDSYPELLDESSRIKSPSRKFLH